ncbi:PVC-type heme-binding CxxCH protein [Tundrisphaera sp. TA3]|uniref:PVC-type heme-binding CxxCH protein n=1 Tax=Tundrisphaera sp. TA3 TaxID=3435775 RepID=UPI003EB9975C
MHVRRMLIASAAMMAALSCPDRIMAQGGGGDFVPRRQDRPPGPALSPEEAVRKMTVPDGFTVEVVASEPDLVNPVAMTFDERGRVWVTESLEYPRHPAGPGRDRIKILEDTDGDGKSDKFTVFADGLNIPSGIAVGAGGVWVANAPDILFLRDTDGDGKADTREVVLTGFGRDDTHELPNSLSWGPDGWLYGWNGVFNPAHIVHQGKTYDFTCALFRIHPRTRAFELFSEGTSNPWGVTWNQDGDAFASACVIDHLWHLTESGYYHRQGGPYPPFTWKLESIVGYQHQLAAYCGIQYFDSDAYPEQYRDRLFMGNIHANGINVDRIARKGATYQGAPDPDFLLANDVWFMPVSQKVGPDGCLYILDWYDRYHCYQDASRDPAGVDRLNGRLYRVRYKDTPRAPAFDLAGESDDALIARLGHANIYYRENAQRILRERDNPASRPKLEALAFDAGASRKARMHALWTLIGTGRLDPAFHGRLLADADPVVRAWGVRAAGNFGEVDPAIRDAVRSLAADPSPIVRVQVAISSRKIAGIDPLPTLLATLSGDDAGGLLGPIVWQNLHPLLDDRAAEFVRTIAAHPKLDSPMVLALLPRAFERILAGARPQAEPADALLGLLLGLKSPEGRAAASRTLRMLADQGRAGLPEAIRPQLRSSVAARLEPLLKGPGDAPMALDAAMASMALGHTAGVEVARAAFLSPKRPEAQRSRALVALIDAGDRSVLDAADTLLAEKSSASVGFRGEVIAALGRVDDPSVADRLLKHYPGLEPELQPRVVEVLTQREPWGRALVAAIADKRVPATAVGVNQVRRLGAIKDPETAARIKATWGSIREGRNPAREHVINRMKDHLSQARGDAVAGAAVFAKVCGQCHKIYGEGYEVGPEITRNGRGSFEQLLSNVFDPSLVIGEAFQATTVATRDGRVLTGLVAEDSPQRLVLKLQGGKLETIAKEDVEERSLSTLSLMPEGLEEQMTPRELADLFAFITLDRAPADPEARPLPGTPPGIRR